MQKQIGYWAATGLVALAIGMGGVMDLMAPPEMVEGMAHLGYPAYFLVILGLYKVAGAITILLPRTPLLKEWAYAGIAFDLTGAAASHAFSGDTIDKVITPLVILAIMAVSWALRPASRRLAVSAEESVPAKPIGTLAAT